MKRTQQGFTLIELVMVIVILGVLAAVALPKFVDLKGDAQIAAAQGVAGALASASTINYSACQVAGTVTAGKCVAVSACADTAALLQTMPSDVTITGVSGTTCRVSNTSVSGASATYTMVTYP